MDTLDPTSFENFANQFAAYNADIPAGLQQIEAINNRMLQGIQTDLGSRLNNVANVVEPIASSVEPQIGSLLNDARLAINPVMDRLHQQISSGITNVASTLPPDNVAVCSYSAQHTAPLLPDFCDPTGKFFDQRKCDLLKQFIQSCDTTNPNYDPNTCFGIVSELTALGTAACGLHPVEDKLPPPTFGCTIPGDPRCNPPPPPIGTSCPPPVINVNVPPCPPPVINVDLGGINVQNTIVNNIKNVIENTFKAIVDVQNKIYNQIVNNIQVLLEETIKIVNNILNDIVNKFSPKIEINVEKGGGGGETQEGCEDRFNEVDWLTSICGEGKLQQFFALTGYPNDLIPSTGNFWGDYQTLRSNLVDGIGSQLQG